MNFNLFSNKKKALNKDKFFDLKIYFRAFFEGNKEIDKEAIIPIPIEHLQINDLEAFQLKDNTIELTVYSVRPGLMIGKKGDVIRKLGGYLSSVMATKVKVCVKERNIWSK